MSAVAKKENTYMNDLCFRLENDMKEYLYSTKKECRIVTPQQENYPGV